jgi:hypothetical protein
MNRPTRNDSKSSQPLGRDLLLAAIFIALGWYAHSMMPPSDVALRDDMSGGCHVASSGAGRVTHFKRQGDAPPSSIVASNEDVSLPAKNTNASLTYEGEVARLRIAAPQRFSFSGVNLQDLLTALALEAKMKFTVEDNFDAAETVALTLDMRAPFAALELAANVHNAELRYDVESGLWHFKKLRASDPVSKTYPLQLPLGQTWERVEKNITNIIASSPPPASPNGAPVLPVNSVVAYDQNSGQMYVHATRQQQELILLYYQSMQPYH